MTWHPPQDWSWGSLSHEDLLLDLEIHVLTLPRTQELMSDYSFMNLLDTNTDSMDTLNQDYLNTWGRLGNYNLGDGEYTTPSDDLDGFKTMPNWHLSRGMLGAGLTFADNDNRFSWGLHAAYFPARSIGDTRSPFTAHETWGGMPYMPGAGIRSLVDNGGFVTTDGGRGPDITEWVPNEEYIYGDSWTFMISWSWSW